MPVVRVDAPTGTYPVADNNLCNTTLFRPCQDGTDHDLWEAGYWANDRYDHWEHGGWNLDIVYHQNACKSNQLCTTKEAWDAGRVAAELLAVTATPDVTQTPVVIIQTVEVGVRDVWETFTGDDAALFGGDGGGTVAQLYTPLPGLYPRTTGTRWGEFILKSESIRVDCYYWHNAYEEENVKLGKFGVNLGRLLERTDEGRPNPDDIAASNLNCGSESRVASDVFARQWKIRVSRNYSGRDQIGGIRWNLEATYGTEPVSAIASTCIVTPCVTEMEGGLYNYIRSTLPTPAEGTTTRTPRENFATVFPEVTTCTLRTTSSGRTPREITRYEHTCVDDDDNLQYTLTFNYTRDETKGFAPQPTPD